MNSTPSSPETDKKQPVFKAVAASPENRELYLLGKKMIEGSIESVQDSLKQILTLATALLGGSIAFMSEQLVPTGFKAGTAFCFLLTVGVSLWGMMPYVATDFTPNFPQIVRETRDRALGWKLARLKLAGWLLLLGFLIACLGLVVRAYVPVPTHPSN